MKNKPTIWAIIPAKGRSTRIPGKNLKDLCGKPMLAYILETVNSVIGVDRVIVTTDSEEVKEVAERYAADVPFLRPIELSEDAVTTREVLHHTLTWFEENENTIPDYILLLYPTSPLLTKARIEEAIAIALNHNSDSVISGELDKGHYWKEVEGGWTRLYPELLANSQFSKPLFVENGAIYMTRSHLIKRQLIADKADILIMEPGENIDVDYPEDFAKVEEILRAKNV